MTTLDVGGTLRPFDLRPMTVTCHETSQWMEPTIVNGRNQGVESVMDDVPDAELMRRTARADESAFAILLRRHQDRVFGTVARMLGRDHFSEAEDLSQQVFLRVYKAAGAYRPEAKFTTWLFTICRNTVFTHLKRQGRWRREEPTTFEDGEESSPLSKLPDPSSDGAVNEYLRKEMVEALEKAMAELPESQRMALILRQYEQMDYEEIARVLDQSVSGVKSLLFRARDRLRTVLANYLNE